MITWLLMVFGVVFLITAICRFIKDTPFLRHFSLALATVGLVLALVALGSTIQMARGEAHYPAAERVVDEYGVLSMSERYRLRQRLASIENSYRGRPQTSILIPKTLFDLSIEQYSNEVFKRWRLGTRGIDNGVLVVVAPKEKKLRIEVGYGLEGTIPDVVAGDITRMMIPYIVKSQWFVAFTVAINQIEQRIKADG